MKIVRDSVKLIKITKLSRLREILPTNELHNLNRWYELVNKRKAVQRGLLVPKAHPPEEQFKAFVSAVVGLGELHF